MPIPEDISTREKLDKAIKEAMIATQNQADAASALSDIKSRICEDIGMNKGLSLMSD